MALPVVQPRPAATVVLLRPGPEGPEALLTHRPSTMAFAADMHVFPGGRVDPADADPRVSSRSVLTAEAAADGLGGDLGPTEALAHYVAAIRETFEEVGVLLADVPASSAAALAGARDRLLADAGAFPAVVDALDLRLRTDLLVPLSRWVTPPTMDRRFDARFFAAPMPADAELRLVGDEVVAGDWSTPRSALEAMAAGAIGLWLPTSVTLQQLEHVSSVEGLSSLAPGRLGDVVVEVVADDIVRIEMPAGGGVAGQPVFGYLVGRESFVLIDPGDPTGPALERAIEVAASRGGRIVAIALTHLDPDHAAGAEALMEQLDVPAFARPDRAADVPYDIASLGDGQALAAGDVALRTLATPGPSSDHAAFVIGDGAFVVSGDLDRRRGARSIPGPSDEAAWTASVKRLRSMAPAARWLGGHPATS